MVALARAGWQTWVSYEPALGPVDWKGWEFLNQLVAGGESGPQARPMHPDWARAARDWCVENGVPFFFKQWGEHLPVGGPEHYAFERMGKHKAGRVLDGLMWSEKPKAKGGA